MTNPIWLNIHPSFKLNGIGYAVEDLWEVGYSLLKEGEPFETAMGEFFLDWAASKETIKVSTSGSTGEPKSMDIKKEWMINSAMATGSYFRLEAGDKALLCLPSSSIAGKMMLVRAMVLGLHLEYVEPTSFPLSTVQNTYDFVAMVPLQVQNSLDKLAQVKKLIIGGASVNADLRKKLGKAPHQVYETYGMTETVSHIAVKDLGRKEDSFEVLPNIGISKDSRECLVINAPHLSDSEVSTNDIVEVMDQGHFRWLGRYDNIINSGGIKLVPEQIEAKIASVIDARFFVAGFADPTLGERLILVVEDGNCDRKSLQHRIEDLKDVGRYEIPKDIFCVDSFIETATGKIQRDKTLSLIT